MSSRTHLYTEALLGSANFQLTAEAQKQHKITTFHPFFFFFFCLSDCEAGREHAEALLLGCKACVFSARRHRHLSSFSTSLLLDDTQMQVCLYLHVCIMYVRTVRTFIYLFLCFHLCTDFLNVFLSSPKICISSKKNVFLFWLCCD